MPYSTEHANPIGYVSIAASPYIKEKLSTFKADSIFKQSNVYDKLQPVNVKDLPQLEKTPPGSITRIVAIDGSLHRVDFNHESAELCFIKIGVIFENLSKLRNIDTSKPVNPELARNAYSSSTLETVVPGSGVTDAHDTKMSSLDKFRLEVYSNFRDLKLPDKNNVNATSLLDVFCDLIADRDGWRGDPKLSTKCLYCKRKTLVPRTPVNCKNCGKRLYITDNFNLHDGFSEHDNATGIFSEIMITIERVLMAGLIYKVYNKSENNMTHQTLFITDGPLAIFKSLELSKMLLSQVQELQTPILIGLDKTGSIVNFANSKPMFSILPAGHVVMLTDEVYREVTGREVKEKSELSEGTVFYGRYFIYRTLEDDKFFVFSTPPLSGLPYQDSSDLSDDWNNYPQVAAITSVLEEVKIKRFEDAAISSINKANDAASIPKNIAPDSLIHMIEEAGVLEEN